MHTLLKLQTRHAPMHPCSYFATLLDKQDLQVMKAFQKRVKDQSTLRELDREGQIKFKGEQIRKMLASINSSQELVDDLVRWSFNETIAPKAAKTNVNFASPAHVIESQEDHKEDQTLNVLGEPLESCSMDPLTGFTRTGCCESPPSDRGAHTVCIIATEEFLAFSKDAGNDLSTPNMYFGFPGLKPGDSWCLCAIRWVQAYKMGCAPKVRLRATHSRTLGYVSLTILRQYAVDDEQMVAEKPKQ
ncbi:hypothetical protein FGO68_gene15166 [Halteria grandinella]|uniref:DUF2237 domain-containing protein n=1 Tax=Halteria grandinella TaxID=5974 RepID=A0A8J8SZD4_HALGN|nr:hypothetical protein FGO68_gene15166 [Halteria grandinella]